MTRILYCQDSVPTLAKSGRDPGRVVPHTQCAVLLLKGTSVHHLSHDCEWRALGGLSGVYVPGRYAFSLHWV
jgi:hypothetical protein